MVLPITTRQNSFLITASVKHLQRLSIAHVKAWVATEQNGTIICAHCNCTAGLGEACSHISAILFTLDANTQVKSTMSCTFLPCSWLPPSFKQVPFARISAIDFINPDDRHKPGPSARTPPSDTPTPERSLTESQRIIPSPSDLKALYEGLSAAGKPVL